jgi:hypothetical protein
MFVAPDAFDFRLKPDSPALKLGFKPFNLEEVGLYGDAAWAKLPGQIIRKPLELPPLPPRGPQPVDDGFERTAVGETTATAVTSGEGGGASIRVTDETAATGQRCLKFTDASGLKYDWQPHLYYRPRFRKGVIHLSFALRLENDAEFINEWRDASQPYRVGPSIRIQPDGELLANGRPLMKVPIGQWIGLTFEAGLGKQSTQTYTLTVEVPGDQPKRLTDLPLGNPQWRSLRWLGFISLADKKTVIYLDDVKLGVR